MSSKFGDKNNVFNNEIYNQSHKLQDKYESKLSTNLNEFIKL
jgi:hypothetical protein